MSKKCFKEKHVQLLLNGEGETSTMFLSKIPINSCMIYTLHLARKYCCCYFSQPFRTAKTLKCHIKE